MARGPKNNQMAQQLELLLGNPAFAVLNKRNSPDKSAVEAAKQATAPPEEVLALKNAKAFWVKQGREREWHWATLVSRPNGGIDLYFIKSNSWVLDVLGRLNLNHVGGVAELKKNGFRMFDPSNPGELVQPKPPYFYSADSITKIYSAARSWIFIDPGALEEARDADTTVPIGVGKAPEGGLSDDKSKKLMPFAVLDATEFKRIGFNWVVPISTKERFQFDFGDGHRFQISSDGQGAESEIVMGLDFGTSSTKVAIRDCDRSLTFPIFYPDGKNVNSQLVPTAVVVNGDCASLNGIGNLIDDLKIRALKTGSDIRSLSSCVAYLALIIRYARGQLWKKYSASFKGRDLKWRFHFGIPAADVRDFALRDRYLAIARAAVLLSEVETEAINLSHAEKTYQECLSIAGLSVVFGKSTPALKRTFYDDLEYFSAEGVKIWPEVMAQTFGFLRSNLWNPDRMSRVMTIDVGAGTLDISLCEVTISRDGDSQMIFTPLATFVDGLGLRNFVTHRMDFVKGAGKSPDIKLVLQELEKQLYVINWVDTRVPSALFETGGFFPLLLTEGDSATIDRDFRTQIGKIVWSNTVLPAFSSGNYSQSAELPVFLCGGGKDVEFYRALVAFYADARGLRVRFDMRDVRSSNDFIDSAPEVFDRVSVAYGLAFPDLGQFIDDGFGAPRKKLVLDLVPIKPNWADTYVDKDMV